MVFIIAEDDKWTKVFADSVNASSWNIDTRKQNLYVSKTDGPQINVKC